MSPQGEREAVRVLIVEDETAIALALRSLFRQQGLETVLCRTLAEAREVLSRGEDAFDWVLLDLMLPDGDGEEILEQVQAGQAPTQVVVMTGIGDPQRLQEIRDMRPAAVLRKPISFDEITQAMGLD